MNNHIPVRPRIIGITLKRKENKTMIQLNNYSLKMKHGFVSNYFLQVDDITLDTDPKPYTLFFSPEKRSESIYDSTWYIYITHPVFAKSELFMYKIYSKQPVSYQHAFDVYELSRTFGVHRTNDKGFVVIPYIYTENDNNTELCLQPCLLSTVPVDSCLSNQTR